MPGGDFSLAEVEATIGVGSIDTREPQRDAHLLSADFFDAQQFPSLHFKSRRVGGVAVGDEVKDLDTELIAAPAEAAA